MGLFKNRKPPKDTNSVAFKRYMAKKLDGKHLKCVLEKEENNERVIGREGFICIKGDELLVVAFGKEDTLFRAKIDTLSAWEFMSLNGVVLTAYDLEKECERTVHAYYSYHTNINIK